MANPVVIDTGPLVALIDHEDEHHAWATAQTKSLQPPFFTCEAVISECIFLLPHARRGLPTLLRFLDEGFVRVTFGMNENLEAVSRMLLKYQDVPMSLADACLVRMSELHDGARVFTLDSDFKLYRRQGRHVIPLISPV